MGNWNSGRRPEPTALKVLRGKTRNIRRDEPKPAMADDSFDTPPPEIECDDVASAEWKRVVPILRVTGIIATTDKTALIALCQQWALYQRAIDGIQTDGLVIEKPSGIPIVNPYLAISQKALHQCLQLWIELGMTPAGRTKIGTLPGGRKDPQTPASKWAGLL